MQSLASQVGRFGLIGLVNTLIDFGLFNCLLLIFASASAFTAAALSVVSSCVAMLNSYYWNRRWTFPVHGGNTREQLLRFLACTMSGAALGSILVAAVCGLAGHLPWPRLLVINTGKCLAAAFTASWNFLTYRTWVFAERSPRMPFVRMSPDCIPGLVSIIIPAFNEAGRLPRRLRHLATSLPMRLPVEIIVVDDGSTDNTFELAQAIAATYPVVRCERYEPNRGKGAAVRHGVMAAHGEYLIFTDADDTFGEEDILAVARAVAADSDLAIACRSRNAWRRDTGEPVVRQILGLSFNILVRSLVLPGLKDSQCGLKGFKRQAAAELFSRQSVSGFAFDVELLALARRLGLRITEIQVKAADCPGSSVRCLSASLQMAWDVLRVKWLLTTGYYQVPGQEVRLVHALQPLIIFLLAFLVRLPWLWDVPRYIDELREVNLAYQIYSGQILPLHNVAHDIGPLHNYILAGIFWLAGPSIYWPRLYVAFTSALTVVLVYYIGRVLFGQTAGLIASLLLLANGTHVLVTHMAWSNSTTPFFFSAALLATIMAEKKKSGKLLVLAAFLWGVALQTHSSVIIYVVAAACYVLGPSFRLRSGLKPGVYAACAGALAVAYGNMIFYNVVSRGGSFVWIGHKTYALEQHPGWSSYLHNLAAMFIELLRCLSSAYEGASSGWAYLVHPGVALALMLLIWGLVLAWQRGHRLLLYMILFSFLIMPWLNNRYVFYLSTRYIMPAVICSLLLVALALNQAFSRLASRAPRVVCARPVMAWAVAFLLATQITPQYAYCLRAHDTNESNHLTLQVVSAISRSQDSLVLVDAGLPIENSPLPSVLTLMQKHYRVIDSGSARDLTELVHRPAGDLVLVLASDTYHQLREVLPPYAAAKRFTCRITMSTGRKEKRREVFVIKI